MNEKTSTTLDLALEYIILIIGFITIAVVVFIASSSIRAQELSKISKTEKPISQMTAPEMKAKIAETMEAIETLQVLLVQLQGGISGIPETFTFQNNLKYGQHNTEVRYLQIILNTDSDTRVSNMGYGSLGQETNYFGSKTLQAVIRFQEKHKQEVLSPWNFTKGTGYVGRTTRNKLNDILEQLRATGEQEEEEEEEEEELTYCGDNIIQTPNNEGTHEVCDSSSLGGETCQTRGYASGILSCSSDCLTFNASGCSSDHEPINNPPEIDPIGGKFTDEGQCLTFTIKSSDSDGDTLTYATQNLPPGASFNFSNRTFSWTPGHDQSGTYNITFKVSDGSLTDSETITITVQDMCQPTTCNELGYECGTWPDDCGRTLNCGTCDSGYTCSGGTCIETEEICDGVDNDGNGEVDERCVCEKNIVSDSCNIFNSLKQDNSQAGFQCESSGCSVWEKWCEGTDINKDGIVNNADLEIFQLKKGSTGCDIANLWCDYADLNRDGAVTEIDTTLVLDYMTEECSKQNEWCESADVNRDGGVNFLDMSVLAGRWGRTNCDELNSWCDYTDINRDGSVDQVDMDIIATHTRVPFYGCDNSENIFFECYSSAECLVEEKGKCESEPGCLWFNPELDCDSFVNAVWSENGDVLADGEFNRTGPIQNLSWDAKNYLEVVALGESYVLKTNGQLGTHKFERVVVKDFPGKMGSWGGRIYVNLGDVEYATGIIPSDLAFLGAYNSAATTERDFGIVLKKHCVESSPCIYMRPYYHNNVTSSGHGQEFPISSNGELPDEFIKIEWFFTPGHGIYGRVNNGKWKKVSPIGNNKVDFERVDIGWVSSFSGGSIYFKDFRLYDESCLPSWMQGE